MSQAGELSTIGCGLLLAVFFLLHSGVSVEIRVPSTKEAQKMVFDSEYDLGYPVYGAQFLSDGMLLVAGGGGVGVMIPNKLTALRVNFEKKKVLKRYREITLDSQDDSPSNLGVAQNIILMGCNEGYDKISSTGENHHIRKFVFENDHLKFIGAIDFDGSTDPEVYTKLICMSKDGTIAAIASSKLPTVIRIIDPIDLTEKYEIETGRDVRDIHFSPDGKLLVYITATSLEVVSVVTGRFLFRKTDFNKATDLARVKFINDDDFVLASGFKDKTGIALTTFRIRNTNPTILSSKKVFKDYKKITAMDVDPKGQLIALTTDDNSLALLSVKKLNVIKLFKQVHKDTITRVTVSPGGQYVATGSTDKTVHIFKISPDAMGGSNLWKSLLRFLFNVMKLAVVVIWAHLFYKYDLHHKLYDVTKVQLEKRSIEFPSFLDGILGTTTTRSTIIEGDIVSVVTDTAPALTSSVFSEDNKEYAKAEETTPSNSWSSVSESYWPSEVSNDIESVQENFNDIENKILENEDVVMKNDAIETEDESVGFDIDDTIKPIAPIDIDLELDDPLASTSVDTSEVLSSQVPVQLETLSGQSEIIDDKPEHLDEEVSEGFLGDHSKANLETETENASTSISIEESTNSHSTFIESSSSLEEGRNTTSESSREISSETSIIKEDMLYPTENVSEQSATDKVNKNQSIDKIDVSSSSSIPTSSEGSSNSIVGDEAQMHISSLSSIETELSSSSIMINEESTIRNADSVVDENHSESKLPTEAKTSIVGSIDNENIDSTELNNLEEAVKTSSNESSLSQVTEELVKNNERVSNQSLSTVSTEHTEMKESSNLTEKKPESNSPESNLSESSLQTHDFSQISDTERNIVSSSAFVTDLPSEEASVNPGNTEGTIVNASLVDSQSSNSSVKTVETNVSQDEQTSQNETLSVGAATIDVIQGSYTSVSDSLDGMNNEEVGNKVHIEDVSNTLEIDSSASALSEQGDNQFSDSTPEVVNVINEFTTTPENETSSPLASSSTTFMTESPSPIAVANEVIENIQQDEQVAQQMEDTNSGSSNFQDTQHNVINDEL